MNWTETSLPSLQNKKPAAADVLHAGLLRATRARARNKHESEEFFRDASEGKTNGF